MNPAGTWRLYNVVSTSIQRHIGTLRVNTVYSTFIETFCERLCCYMNPAGTWRLYNVVSTSIQRHIWTLRVNTVYGTFIETFCESHCCYMNPAGIWRLYNVVSTSMQLFRCQFSDDICRLLFYFNTLWLGKSFICKVEKLNVKQRRSRFDGLLSGLIWIYIVCKSILLSPVVVKELKGLFKAAKVGLSGMGKLGQYEARVCAVFFFFCFSSLILLVPRDGCASWLWHFLGIFTCIRR